MLAARRPSKNAANRKQAQDHGPLWSRNAARKPTYNRMDPDPDSDSDKDVATNHALKEANIKLDEINRSKEVPLRKTRSTLHRDKLGNVRKFRKHEWRKFWAGRLRHIANCSHLTDSELYDAVERFRRVFHKNSGQTQTTKKGVDPDMPPCYYWDKFRVADWAANRIKDIPRSLPIKDIFLHSEINGRRLVMLDVNALHKMGITDFDTAKHITLAIRNLLGLPIHHEPQAIGRFVPLEKFLMAKIRTGVNVDKMTFRDFCELEGLDYLATKKQMYQQLPYSCGVMVQPGTLGQPYHLHIGRGKPRKNSLGVEVCGGSYDSLRSGSGAGSEVYGVPTVEALVNNVLLRKTYIPSILDEIIERVFEAVSKTEDAKQKQRISDGIFQEYMDHVYSKFSVFDLEAKLKFLTIIAEELVEDVMKAKNVLSDIDDFQEKLKSDVGEEEMASVQDAVNIYIDDIMPLVVSSALKLLEEGTNSLDASTSTTDRPKETGQKSGSPSNKPSTFLAVPSKEKQVSVIYGRENQRKGFGLTDSIYHF